MSDKYTTIINSIELVAGGVLAFLAYAGKALHNKFLKLIDRVEELEKEQREDALYIKQIEKDYQNEVKRVESEVSTKFDSLQELSRLQFDQLHSDINDLKSAVGDINKNIQNLFKSIV